ncbi:nucleoside/nucleotide kinase family protein [uncultured Pseudokineococcus sp.]|uniref:nucleoside/nucleotide kinase family protein n=1 Tax=uncultured Pseudokineococcus sp. TaxID=1642928 RepID=UPI00261D0ACE|nr:nucleoside/nucleotide kinase family protein [uncultured Pseudokineococcus sp.]
MRLEELVDRAVSLLEGRHRVLLGVAGAPAAGKTTLARAVAAGVDLVLTDRGERAPGGPPAAVQVPMDGFHLADVQLEHLGLADRKGVPASFDAGGYVSLLRRLRAADEDVVYAPAFERDLEQALAGAIAVPREARLVVTEGNYLLLDEAPWDAVRPLLDEVWFAEADEEERSARLLARHVEFGKTPEAAQAWMASVDDPDAALAARGRALADLVVRTAAGD